MLSTVVIVKRLLIHVPFHKPTKYDMVRIGIMVRYGAIWYYMIRYGTMWYGMIGYVIIWYGIIPYGKIWYGMIRYGTV